MGLIWVNSAFNHPAGTSTTCAISYTPAQAGNLIVAGFIDNVTGVHTPTIADANLSTWGTANSNKLSSFCSGTIFYCNSIAPGSNTITITTTSCSFRAIYISEFRGHDAVNALDGSNSATNSGAGPVTINSGNVTTAIAHELIYSLVGCTTGIPTTTDGATVDNNDSTDSNATGWRIVSTQGTYSAGWTNLSSCTWLALIATFKESVSGGILMMTGLGN